MSVRSSAGLIVIAVDLLRLGQHGDGAGGGVHAALGLGLGHALHPVGARLELEPRVGAAADDPADDFLEAAVLAAVGIHDLDLPAAVIGVPGIHAEQVAGEDRRPRRRRPPPGSRGRCCCRRGGPSESAAGGPAPRVPRVRCGCGPTSSWPSRRISASLSFSISAAVVWSASVLRHSRNRLTTGVSWAYSRDRSRNRAWSPMTRGSFSSSPSSSERSTEFLELFNDGGLHSRYYP